MLNNEELNNYDYEIKSSDLNFIKANEFIQLPNKVVSIINKIETKSFKNINKNSKVAKELCLYFISFITHTQYSNNRYVNLNSLVLSKLLRKSGVSEKTVDSKTYKAIIDLLVLNKIIIVDNHYTVGEHSRAYSLTNEFYDNGHIKYTFKTKYLIDLVYRNTIDNLAKAHRDSIARNTLKFYTTLTLPSKETILNKGKELIKDKYTKKGKKLTMQYRKPKSYWADCEKRTFVEDAIKRFDFYTNSGFIIPIVGESYCPRVYDSINLLNSWIRPTIKSNGENLIETDIKCLHPNLIMNIYNGDIKNITHKKVAEYLEIKDEEEVKILHLSFFNMKVEDMQKSPLWKYYEDNCKFVLDQIVYDKIMYGHKHTSKLLFILETEIMETTIEKLNNEGIYVGYVFDALYGTKSNIKIVDKYLNETLSELNIYTTTKRDTNTKPEIVSNTNTSVNIEESQTETETIDMKAWEDFITDRIVNKYNIGYHILRSRNNLPKYNLFIRDTYKNLGKEKLNKEIIINKLKEYLN